MLTRSPQNIDAITATKDFDILVRSKKEVITDKKSVIKKFFNNKFLIKFGRCRKEKTKLSQVKSPNNSPSYMIFLVRSEFHFYR